ncbi:MAG: c-type cytochrome [Pseudomonadota bacterium]
MDTMEINKIVGAVVGALLVYLGVQFFADMILVGGGHGEHEYAYSLEIEEEGGEAGAEEEEVDFAALLAEADPSRGERVYGKCRACHNLDGSNATGPHLDGVVDREVGAVDGFSYSGALSEAADVWTPENLNKFLEKPSDFAPGTAMSFAGLRSVEDRAALVAYLETVGSGD